MKKSILIIALALISVATIAQKRDTTAKKPVSVKDTVSKKPQFKPDYQVERIVKLTAADASLLIMTPEDWNQLEWSQQTSGAQIQQTKVAASVARQKLINQVTALISTEEQKFKADTNVAAKAKPIKK